MRSPAVGETDMPCRQSLNGEFIERREKGREETGVGTGAAKEKKQTVGVAKTCLPLQKNSGRGREWAENGQSLSLEGTFCTCVQTM